MKTVLAIIVALYCIAQWTSRRTGAAVVAPSPSLTHLRLPTAEAPLAAESSKGYTAQALADSVDELPGWGKLDFNLYSGYASRWANACNTQVPAEIKCYNNVLLHLHFKHQFRNISRLGPWFYSLVALFRLAISSVT